MVLEKCLSPALKGPTGSGRGAGVYPMAGSWQTTTMFLPSLWAINDFYIFEWLKKAKRRITFFNVRKWHEAQFQCASSLIVTQPCLLCVCCYGCFWVTLSEGDLFRQSLLHGCGDCHHPGPHASTIALVKYLVIYEWEAVHFYLTLGSENYIANLGNRTYGPQSLQYVRLSPFQKVYAGPAMVGRITAPQSCPWPNLLKPVTMLPFLAKGTCRLD